MSRNASRAEKESFGKVDQTCPDIDNGLAELERIIKDKTNSLRNALTDTIGELLDAQDKIADLEAKLSDANERIAQLEAMLEAKERENGN